MNILINTISRQSFENGKDIEKNIIIKNINGKNLIKFFLSGENHDISMKTNNYKLILISKETRDYTNYKYN